MLALCINHCHISYENSHIKSRKRILCGNNFETHGFAAVQYRIKLWRPTFFSVIHKTSVATPQITRTVSTIRTNQWMLLRDMIGVYHADHMKYINTLWKSAEFLKVTACSICSYFIAVAVHSVKHTYRRVHMACFILVYEYSEFCFGKCSKPNIIHLNCFNSYSIVLVAVKPLRNYTTF